MRKDLQSPYPVSCRSQVRSKRCVPFPATPPHSATHPPTYSLIYPPTALSPLWDWHAIISPDQTTLDPTVAAYLSRDAQCRRLKGGQASLFSRKELCTQKFSGLKLQKGFKFSSLCVLYKAASRHNPISHPSCARGFRSYHWAQVTEVQQWARSYCFTASYNY